MMDAEGLESEREPEDQDHARSSWMAKTVGMVIPCLTTENGKKSLTLRKSFLVVMFLYSSHAFSAWGDRMWSFAVSLFLVLLYPGSLLLPGIHGFFVQLAVAVFGTIVGGWVDYYARMKVITMSLVVQNGLLVLSSIVMAVMFYFDLNVCHNVLVFGILTVIVILLTSGANLATVANTISIEKDWIVIIADGSKDTLAVLNANMRRIDLCCKLLAPAMTGIILQHAGPFATTVIVAMWNVVSFCGELGLLWIVYKLLPTLAVKKLRHKPTDEKLKEIDENTSEDEALISEENDDESDQKNNNEQQHTCINRSTCLKRCSVLLTYPFIFKDALKIYMKQEIALVGLSMATIYLTVLGFSGVTSSYFLTQGLRNDLIGVFQGVGAIFGVSGTILYPFLRKRIGTVRTGLFGISTQLLILLFCIAAIIVPSNKFSREANGYYSPDCSDYLKNDTINITDIPLIMCTSETKQLTSLMPLHTMTLEEYVFANNTSSPILMPSNCIDNSSSVPTSKENAHISISLILMLVGVVGCRIGLWTFDLAVQQLLQEKVIDEERGVVSGVMTAMNSIMDMFHYILVIVAPRPENFNILTAISFSMVALGWLFYSIYVRKSRGHFFHVKDCTRKIIKRKEVRLEQVGFEHSLVNSESEDV